MKLIGGKEEWEGRLEVCQHNRWGTVGLDSDEDWSQYNNQTICGYFGYQATSKF